MSALNMRPPILNTYIYRGHCQRMHIVGHHDILVDPCKHNSWPDMLKELREDVSWGGPLEIPLTEFADSCVGLLLATGSV